MRRGVGLLLLGLVALSAGVLLTRLRPDPPAASLPEVNVPVARPARETSPEPLREGRRLLRMAPALAVDAALRRGDCRMYALSGFGPVVPVVDGLPQPVRVSIEAYGLHFIPGAVHATVSDDERRFYRYAHRYAGRYNRILLDRLTGPDGRIADGGACRRAAS